MSRQPIGPIDRFNVSVPEFKLEGIQLFMKLEKRYLS
jgi:hypothetical protein